MPLEASRGHKFVKYLYGLITIKQLREKKLQIILLLKKIFLQNEPKIKRRPPIKIYLSPFKLFKDEIIRGLNLRLVVLSFN